jgi:hypothetical protein
MKTAIAKLKSVSPLQYNRHYNVDKLERELANAYEQRTWRERAHVNEDGRCIIPPMMFKNCIAEAAKYMSIQIPGKGKSTYTKHFEAGVLVVEPLLLPMKKDELERLDLFVPADGRRGSSTRVEKCFPIVQKWEGEVPFLIFDEIITEDVFLKHLEAAGQFIGIGGFRPRNNGYFGRFQVIDVKWA